MRLTGEQGTAGLVFTARPRPPQAWMLAIVAVALLLVFALDRATESAPFQHLYYLPIFFASLYAGWNAGISTSLAAIVLYHLANPALLSLRYREADLVQMCLFMAVGAVTSKLAEDRRRLRTLAMTDDLTGLHNLRSFETRLGPLVHAAREPGGSLGLLVLDVDRLKSLNDAHGHLTGADAVRTVGRLLADRLPPEAIACRYGGDEFVVALPGRTCAQAHLVADDLRRAVVALEPVLAGTPFPVATLSISIGVACLSSRSGGAPADAAAAGEALFQAADRALYAAKGSGRNRVSVA